MVQAFYADADARVLGHLAAYLVGIRLESGNLVGIRLESGNLVGIRLGIRLEFGRNSEPQTQTNREVEKGMNKESRRGAGGKR